ncbi:MAG: thymidine phosphorylase [Pirellulaceae bacterium]
MLTASALIKKRDGKKLSGDEIRFLIQGYCDGSVADYQMAAFAMAVCIQGMTQRETADLTQAMLESGDRLPRTQSVGTDATRKRPRIDKHSTGGLGDKVSLVLAPLLAEVGGDVPMISGRGLGLTGGTLDKLESIPGFQSQLTTDQSSKLLRDVGAFIIGASDRLAPADRKLYSLRDVTGTVESVPLITASILSKKLAANLDALVMDVKVGQAAAMKTLPEATELAKSLIQVGRRAGLPVSVIVSDMEQPLGHAVGNALEVIESIKVLEGGGPADVRKLTLELAANLLLHVNLASTRETAIDRLEAAIDSGRAMDRFEKMIRGQGGDPTAALTIAPGQPVCSDRDGFLADLDCQAIGSAVVAMGGGRRQVHDRIDPSVGVTVHAKIGDEIAKGQPVLTVHCPATSTGDYVESLAHAFTISSEAVPSRRLIMRRFDEKDFRDDTGLAKR